MFQQFLNFLVLGSMYSVVALGFTLYFGTVGLINFAHGELCMLATFFLLGILSLIGSGATTIGFWLFFLALIIAIFLCVLVGLISEVILFRPIRDKPPLEGLIVSIAFSMLLRELILHFYPNGGNPQPFPDPFHQKSLQILDANLAYSQLFLIVICLGLIAVFYWIARKTYVGRAMRAISQDPEAAEMIGLPVDRTISWAFALGAFFAATAGIINGIVYGSVKFDMGISLGIKGFVAAVIGGLDNSNGAFLGGMLLALIETSIIAYIPGGSSFRDIIAFSLLLIIMLVRPTGLLGTKGELA